MSVEIKATGETVTAFLKGEIDHHTAGDMRRKIDESVDLNMPDVLSLDFSAVTFMDSSGIGLVMGRYRSISKYDGILRIVGTSEQQRKIMRLAGLGKIASIEEH